MYNKFTMYNCTLAISFGTEDFSKPVQEPSGLSGRLLIIRSFGGMKRLRIFLPSPPTPLDGMLIDRRVISSSKYAGTHLYTWKERGTVRVKCLAQEHNTTSTAGQKPRLLDLDASALTARPLRLP